MSVTRSAMPTTGRREAIPSRGIIPRTGITVTSLDTITSRLRANIIRSSKRGTIRSAATMTVNRQLATLKAPQDISPLRRIITTRLVNIMVPRKATMPRDRAITLIRRAIDKTCRRSITKQTVIPRSTSDGLAAFGAENYQEIFAP